MLNNDSLLENPHSGEFTVTALLLLIMVYIQTIVLINCFNQVFGEYDG